MIFASASAPFCDCVCRLMQRPPSRASTDVPTLTARIRVTEDRMELVLSLLATALPEPFSLGHVGLVNQTLCRCPPTLLPKSMVLSLPHSSS